MKTINGSSYASQEAFTKDADALNLSRNDLQNLYNSIAGAPVVVRLRNRPYAIERIWAVAPVAPVAQEQPTKEPKVPGDSKKAMILRMLDGDGTTLERIMTATGWQAHSARGFLSTLRSKDGVKIVSARADKVTNYRIATESAAT